MIRFKIYEHGQPAKNIPAGGAYFFAQDEIPVRSQLEVVQSELIGVRHSETAVGLGIMWDVDGFGRVFLQTTRLPERQEPYILNLEIARGRLLKISQKREEWGMLDMAAAHHELMDDALEHFIDALCHIDEPEKAAQMADAAIARAMRVGEAMALAHAQLFLQRRSSTQGFGRHCFGGTIDPRRINEPRYQKFIKENFHFVTVPINWKQIEPKEQEQQFEQIDECLKWLSANRIAVKMGPLLNFIPSALPDWLFIWENDFEQVREMAYEYITRVVERYNTKVQAWNVVSGLNAENCFKFSFEQIIEMTRSAALAAKRAAHRSLVLIDITEPWGEYYAFNQRTVPPLIYADVICQSGVNFDGFSLKLRLGRNGAANRTRDLLDISSLLDRFANFGKPVHLSGVQAPSGPDKREPAKATEVGWWHEPWSEAIQGQWLEQVYQIALSKPFVETVTWGDLVDGEEAMVPSGGLLRPDLSPKPAFEKWAELRRGLVRQNRKMEVEQ